MKIDFEVDDMGSIARHISDSLDTSIKRDDINLLGAEERDGSVILKLSITGLSKEDEEKLDKEYGHVSEGKSIDSAVNKLLKE